MEINGKSLIAGKFSEKGDSFFKVSNPLNGKIFDTIYYDASQSEIDQAVTIAASVFTQFRKTKSSERVKLLNEIASQLEKNSSQIIDLCFQETAILLPQLEGEMNRTINQVKLFASFISEDSWCRPSVDLAEPERLPIPKPDIRLTKMPLGVIVVFGAGNFPLAFSVAGGDTISALAAGCPVVYKAHPGHPGTSELVALCIYEAIKECGLPSDIFSIIQGISVNVGRELVTHPLVKGVGFTGSFKGGKALFDLCNKRTVPIPFFGEMGSVNPVFILPEAMKKSGKEIASGLFQSFTLRTGQLCTSPGLFIFIENENSDNFIHWLSDLVQNSDAYPMINEGIRDRYMKKLRETLGKNIIIKRAEGKKSCDYKSSVSSILMTVSAKMFIDNSDLQDEIFGPATLGIAAKSMFDILHSASLIQGQLTSTVFASGDDFAKYSELFSILEEKSGRLIINGFPTGVEVCKSMHHGGPYPASTHSHFTSVGVNAIYRWVRPIAYQNFKNELLPKEIKD